MWSSDRRNEIYFARISRCKSVVNAEICRRFNSNLGEMEIKSYNKTFSNRGMFDFRDYPKDEDWTYAIEWCENELNLIDKYGTNSVDFNIKYN